MQNLNKMEGEASRSNGDVPTADSYIGSLISLISKLEIRYEGLLFDINTAESSIGLRNVKSFGTEGRKKDGPQVPPSDKVYEYILFRGNDIKDLQVKSSQPVEPTSSLFNDPAIIQSHYSQGTVTSINSEAGFPKSGPQGNLHLYQPNPKSGSWGLTPVPLITNNSSFPMPTYMQGFYGASEGIQASQQSFLQSPSGLSVPLSVPQYSVNNAFISSKTSNFSSLPFSVSTPSLLSPIGSGTLNSNLMSPTQTSSLFSDTSTTLMSNKTVPQSLPTTPSYSSLSLSYDTGFKPMSSAPLLVTPNQLLQPGPTSNGLLRPGTTANQVLEPAPMPNQDLQLGNTASQVLQPGPTLSHVFHPGPYSNQLLQTGITTLSSNYSLDSAQKDVEVVQVPSTEPTLTTQNEIQPPLLPLPSQHGYKVNGYHSYACYNGQGHRDRLRGHGGSHHFTRFTEEFDFTAMNEKFKKDEIWGDLGKSNTTGEEQDSPDKDHDGKSNMEFKPVYVKDDFFDSISCNVSDRASKNGRTNFSEQRKQDMETFGNYARHKGGQGHSRGYAISKGHGYNGDNSHGYVGGNARGYGGNGGRGYNGYNNWRGYGRHAT